MPYLMEVENEVEFADIVEVFIQNFNKKVDHFKDQELVVVLVDDGDEVETGVSGVTWKDDYLLYTIL